MNSHGVCASLLLPVVLLPFMSLVGQVGFPDPESYRLDCARLTQLAAAPPPQADWMDLFALCPSAPQMLRSLMLRPELSETHPSVYKRSFMLAGLERDSLIYRAAFQIASDREAPATGRAAAVHLLGQFVSGAKLQEHFGGMPGPIGFPDFFSGCSVWHLQYLGGTELGFPETFVHDLAALADTIQAQATDARMLHALRCLRTGLEIRARSATEVLENPGTRGFDMHDDLEWVAKCGGKFLVRNRSFYWVSLKLYPGSDRSRLHESRIFSMAPRLSPLRAYAEYVWTISPPGSGKPLPAQIVREGKVLLSAVPNFSPC